MLSPCLIIIWSITHNSSYEIMYITSGSCRVFCLDGTQDTEFPLKSGQFIFIRPDVPHRLEIPDGFPCSIMNLEFSLTPKKSPVALELLLKKDPGFSQFWNLWKPPRASAPARIPAASDTA